MICSQLIIGFWEYENWLNVNSEADGMDKDLFCWFYRHSLLSQIEIDELWEAWNEYNRENFKTAVCRIKGGSHEMF